MTDGNLVPEKYRHSDGMTSVDWINLALAYETWNESNDDPDACAFCHDIFSQYDLWDYVYNEPLLSEYRRMIMIRC